MLMFIVLMLNLPPGESLRFPPHLTTGKRDVGRTQGAGKDIRGKIRRELREMRREGEREGLMGAPQSFLASPHK